MIKFPESFKQMQACHKAVQDAVTSGHILKPETCQICNLKKKLIAHHTDYEKPLLVTWICKSCHQKEHAKNGNSGLSNMCRVNNVHAKEIDDFQKLMKNKGINLTFSAAVNLCIGRGLSEVKKSLLK